MDEDTSIPTTISHGLDFGDCEPFRTRFENGDKLALIECLLYCATRDGEKFDGFPDWAQRQLVLAAWKYLSGDEANFHDAIFGARKPRGRKANPSTKRLYDLKHQFWFDAVYAQEKKGIVGDDKYIEAIEILKTGAMIQPDGSLTLGGDNISSEKRRIEVPDVDTLRKKYLKMKKEGAHPRFAFILIPSPRGWPGEDPEQ